MARPIAPFWLARPSRFASLSRSRSRVVLLLLGALLLASLLALRVPEPPAAGASGAAQAESDIALYESIVSAVRAGTNYYPAAADALRAASYPLRPFVTFRLPGLAVMQAHVPDIVSIVLLYALALAVMVAWATRLFAALPRAAPRIAVLLLLSGSMLVFVQSGLVAFHEIWAAQLVALSLALRSPGQWVEAAAIALMAMLIRETAALYVAVMAVLAWREGERREALGWVLALLVFGAALAVHAWAVSGVTGPLDAQLPGWAGLLGFGFFVKSVTVATALAMLPLWLAALLTGLALFGWTCWSDPLGLRMAATLAVYALAIATFGRLDTFYWGLMVAPIFLAGLAFVPDGLRDLVAGALDRRRVRVQIVAR